MNSRPVAVCPGGWVIGVTGGIACGKSTVGRILADAGVDIQEADAVAHAAMAPGGVVYDAVRERFGEEVLTGDGEIDRARLGARVFASPEEREALNAIVHPAVRRERLRWITGLRRRNAVGAAIVPLLFEVGAEDDMDCVVCVRAAPEEMEARLRRRGLSTAQARQRIAAQWPVDEKAKRSDYIIENNEDMDALRRTTRDVLAKILKKERPHHA